MSVAVKVTNKIKTLISFSIIFFFFFENLVAYEKIWKNIVQPDRPQVTIWRMRIACWIPKATNTHTLSLYNIHCFIITFIMTYLSWSCATCWAVPVSRIQISSKVCHDSFCQSGSSVSLPWII